MAYNRKDYYFHKAKEDNFAARSIYKLEEIDAKFRLIKPGNKILDLGAAPGSWSQYASKKVGVKGRVLGIDLQPIKITLSNAAFIEGDIHDVKWDDIFAEFEIAPPFDLVISDMAPRTTGIKITDQARSTELCEMALQIGFKYLKPGGHFVMKFFHSEDFEDLRNQIRKNFGKCEILRPKSTRKESKEIFLIGISYKPKALAPTT
ncbi:MAG: RlmE family RNA methyltransferase [Xanthomonadaceae bacterium]|nr:RlmE family RNA methyltransferase [Xanthomonadaceae bacterium]